MDSNISNLLKKIFTPILLSLGLFGNTISIIIFRRKSFLKSSTFEYLTLISLLDLLTLYTGCSQIFLETYFEIDIRLINQFTCKLHSFLVYYFTHFSSMLLAMMSIDRTIRISIKKDKLILFQHSASKVFLVLGLFIFLVDFHFLIFAQIVDFKNSNSTIQFEVFINTTINKTTFACLCNENTLYYEYLVNFFPWYEFLFI